MNKFLIIVIKAMNTADGNRNSSQSVFNKIIETKRNNEHLMGPKDYDEDGNL